MPLAGGAVAERLGQMRLAGAGGSGNQDRDALVDIAAGGEIMDVGSIQRRQPVEVEGLERLAHGEAGAGQPGAELLLVAPCHFVMQQHGQELGIGKLAVDGLPVTLFKGIEHAGQAQLLEGGVQFRTGVHGRLMDQQGLEVAAEATAVDVGVGERLRRLRDRLALQPLVQDCLDGSPPGTVVGQCPGARRVEPGITDLAAQPDDALRTAQVDEHLVVEQREHQRMAGRPDGFGLCQTPLRIVFEPRLSGGRLMIPYRRACAGLAQPGMGGHEFVLVEQLHDRVSGLYPQRLADQRERHRVKGLVMLDVSIAMNHGGGPCGQHRRHIGQRHQQRLLDGEAHQRLFAGRAVLTHAGLLHDPLAQLPVGIGEVTERTQWHEGLLDVLDSRLDDALLLRVVRRAGVDPEAVSLGQTGVGPLDLGVVRAGPDDGALGVVDDDPFG